MRLHIGYDKKNVHMHVHVQVVGVALWLTALVLGAILTSEVFRLLTEIAKRKKEGQEQLPVLLADLDTLGQDTVYRQTIVGTTEDGTKDANPQEDKKNKKGLQTIRIF
ncbi:hypothetical protein Tcan_12059 [Toxocara canis]|uniref:Uncharacterized protein n=1 Tax=Toxocara canis TaxID=6265 RepID=A0A0B2UNG8_TOXCA|nr:hypothetical protein Tcan_12059 [Toxocara canis]